MITRKTQSSFCRLASLLPLLAVLCAGQARAVDVAINGGLTETVVVPLRHSALYASVGFSVLATFGRVTLVPGLGVEMAPETSSWGLVASLVVDYAVSERIGLDAIVTLVHDQVSARFADAAFLGGLGLGLSIFVGKVIISPSVSVFRGLNVDGWSIVPAVNIAYTL